MIPNSALYPPRNYVKLMTAWLRLGKIAVIGVLAMLVVAVGMAFPGAPAAEAQSSQGGYTYTQRVCQEWGQHPRHYLVRDPIPGSDWRNDGGWAIILDRGSSLSRTTITFVPGSSPGQSLSDFNSFYTTGTALEDNSRGTRSKQNVAPPSWVQLANYEQGTWNGYQGLVLMGTNLDLVAIDVDRDGNIDAQDAVFGPSNNQVWRLWYGTTEEIIGGSTYVRWADLAWCR